MLMHSDKTIKYCSMVSTGKLQMNLSQKFAHVNDYLNYKNAHDKLFNNHLN